MSRRKPSKADAARAELDKQIEHDIADDLGVLHPGRGCDLEQFLAHLEVAFQGLSPRPGRLGMPLSEAEIRVLLREVESQLRAHPERLAASAAVERVLASVGLGAEADAAKAIAGRRS